MGIYPHWLPDIVIVLICVAVLGFAAWTVRPLPKGRRRVYLIAIALTTAWLLFGGALSSNRIASRFPNELVVWVRVGAIIIASQVLGLFVLWALWSALRIERFSPGRRAALRTLQAATLAAPAAVTAFAILERDRLRLREIDVGIRNLHPDLHGLKIVQVSDIHLSPIVTRDELVRAVDMANETKAHLAVVTGDLISRGGDPLDQCIAELRRLRADAGVLGCMGNHEIYAGSERYTAREGARNGLRFLRQEAVKLRFGAADLNLAGVDYQQRNRPYLVEAERLVEPGMPNILLSHNPDVFPVAARKGFELTIAGHTHGGQVNFEILHQQVNIARFLTPYVYGLYRNNDSAVFVTRGIGTVGVPARLGAPPEVALIRLCNI